MELYHITDNLNEPKNKLFIPRIPESAAEDEDQETKRICFSSSIEKCILGHPYTSDILEINNRIRIYKCNTENINKYKLVDPLTLYFTNKVPDAFETQEYWYLDNIVLQSELYEITDFYYEHNLAWSCIKASDVIKEAKDIIGNNIELNNIQYSEFDSQMIYNKVLSLYNDDRLLDGLWDRLALLPWAMSYKISGLKLRNIC